MGGCLNSCYCSEGGLKCHSIITLCGLVYFSFMFLIFEKQKNFFEFPMNDPEGTKYVCLLSALVSLLFFIIILIKLMKIEREKKPDLSKKKISISQYREMKSIRQSQKVQSVRQLMVER